MKIRPFVRILIGRYLWFALFVIVVIIVMTTFVLRYLYEHNVYKPTIEHTVSSIASFIEQWGNTLEAYQASFRTVLTDLLDHAYIAFEDNPTIRDDEIEKLMQGYLSLLTPQGTESANWYLISEKGIVSRTNYPEDLGFDFSNTIKTYWNSGISALKVREKLIDAFAFEHGSMTPRLFSFIRLPNNEIFEIGINLDRTVVSRLWDQLRDYEREKDFIRSIDAYNASFAPFEGFDPVPQGERENFMMGHEDHGYRFIHGIDGVFTIYKNWIPSGLSAFEKAMMLRIRIQVDFSRLENFGRFFVIFINGLFILTIMVIIWSNIHAVKHYFRPLKGFFKKMEEFEQNPADFDPIVTVFPNKSRELHELESIYNRMASTISGFIKSQEMEKETLLTSLKSKEKEGARLDWLASTDELTGLYNRRRFIAELTRAIDSSDKRRSFVVAFIDVDSLKRINDLHGHLYGDKVLQWVGSELKRKTRSTDLVARIGGDEYGILFPGLDTAQAVSVLSRIREGICVNDEFKALGVKVTFSFGVTRYQPGEALSAEGLLALADKEMYRDKRRG